MKKVQNERLSLWLTAIAILGVALASGCNYTVSKGAGGSQGGPNLESISNVQFSDVRDDVFKQSCMPCHATGSRHGSLMEFSSLMSKGWDLDAGPGPVINPADPDNSVLFQDIDQGDMPQNRPKIPQAQIDLVRRWIMQGARDSSSEPIPTPAPSPSPGPSVTPSPSASPTATPVAAPSASPSATPEPSPTPAGPAPSVLDFAGATSYVFQNNCYQCHNSGSKHGDISTYETIMASNWPLNGNLTGAVIVPSDSANSVLFQDISRGDMPKKHPKLQQPLIDYINQWIAAGAPNTTAPTKP